MTRFSTLLTAAGMMVTAPLLAVPLLAVPLVFSTTAIAQPAPKKPSPQANPQANPRANPRANPQQNITEFLVNEGPEECTVQLGYFEGSEFEVVGSQSVESLLSENPLVPCDVITATDSGETKNFNFVKENEALYKIITESSPVAAESNLNEFTVLAIQIVPMDETGALKPDETIQLLGIDEGTCAVDEPTEPGSIVCEFTSISETPSAAIGRLIYGR